MGTSYNQIEKWYKEGKKNGYKYMTVICDTFNWNDYPVYDEKPYSARQERGERFMEVYDLSIPFAAQNGNEAQKRIMQRIEVSVTEGKKVYKILIDCEPKNYDEKTLKDFSLYFEHTLKQFLEETK